MKGIDMIEFSINAHPEPVHRVTITVL